MAPEIELPDAQNRLWSSRKLLGQRGFVLVTAPDAGKLIKANLPSPLLSGENDSSLFVVGVSEKVAPNLSSWATLEANRSILVADKAGLLSKLVPPTTLVVVDKSGWVRAVESAPSAQGNFLQERLREILTKGEPASVLEVGQVAPDFAFKDAFGNWRSLASLRGKKNLVLTFFPKCFTSKCKNHLASLRDAYPQLEKLDTEVWAVSVDAAGGEHGQKAFSDWLHLPFPLLPDVNRNLCLLYGATQSPDQVSRRQSLLIDKNGIIRFVTYDVHPETHGADIVELIQKINLKANQG